jgi:hypothetical protein
MTHEFKQPKYYAEMRKERQAASNKPQATKIQAASGKPQAPSCKPQASSREQQAAQSRYPHKVSSS